MSQGILDPACLQPYATAVSSMTVWEMFRRMLPEPPLAGWRVTVLVAPGPLRQKIKQYIVDLGGRLVAYQETFTPCYLVVLPFANGTERINYHARDADAECAWTNHALRKYAIRKARFGSEIVAEGKGPVLVTSSWVVRANEGVIEDCKVVAYDVDGTLDCFEDELKARTNTADTAADDNAATISEAASMAASADAAPPGVTGVAPSSQTPALALSSVASHSSELPITTYVPMSLTTGENIPIQPVSGAQSAPTLPKRKYRKRQNRRSLKRVEPPTSDEELSGQPIVKRRRVGEQAGFCEAGRIVGRCGTEGQAPVEAMRMRDVMIGLLAGVISDQLFNIMRC